MLDISAKPCYTISCIRGHRTSASISAFQAEEVGSIPIARSMQTKRAQIIWTWALFIGFVHAKKGGAHLFLRGPLIFMYSDEGEIQSACCCAHVGDAEQCTAQRAEVDLG